MSHPLCWDIFCTVVDNYGDAGVCWRLARQLANEHEAEVCLRIDRPDVLATLWPDVDPARPQQRVAGVDVRRWEPADVPSARADVVVEAFACELPPAAVAAMAARDVPPQWINLEYLSAEDWVDECHGLVSIHPQTGLRKRFWIPGFTSGSGGLLRERGLEAQRQSFLTSGRGGFLQALGAPELPDALYLSLFAYSHAPLQVFMGALADGAIPIVCLAAAGAAGEAAARLFGEAAPVAGSVRRKGALTVVFLPFLDQDQYDRLLWSCDLNFVRGEDSFVRAQWAGRPLIWNIYAQDDAAHVPKLEAFLGRYLADAPGAPGAALADFMRAWNVGDAAKESWPALCHHLPRLQRHAEQWRASQFRQMDLVARLARSLEKSL